MVISVQIEGLGIFIQNLVLKPKFIFYEVYIFMSSVLSGKKILTLDPKKENQRGEILLVIMILFRYICQQYISDWMAKAVL